MTDASRNRGFTLIELMVVVTIAAIMLSIAIPTYQSSIRKSRRTEAKTAILDAAAREQRYYATNQSYTPAQGALGYAASTVTTAVNGLSVGSGYYTITITAPTPAAGALATFSVVATTAGTQTADTTCQTFTVTSTGAQSATNSSSTDTTSSCW